MTLQIVILLHESQEWRKLVREEGGALARPDQGDCARHWLHLSYLCPSSFCMKRQGLIAQSEMSQA